MSAARNLLLHNLAASDVRSFEQLDEQVLHVVESLSSLHIAALVFLATHDQIGIIDEGMKLVDKGTHSIELHLEHEHGHGLFAALEALGLAQKWPPPGPAGGAHNTNTRRITKWGNVVARRISEPSWTAPDAG